MNHNPGRDSYIILRVTEKTTLQQIALQPPTDERDQVIVDAATHRIGIWAYPTAASVKRTKTIAMILCTTTPSNVHSNLRWRT